MPLRAMFAILLLLAACAAPSALPTPSGVPRPTIASRPTLPPIEPTILPSDLGKRAPTPSAPPSAESTPDSFSTASVTFDAALRPQFRNDLNLVSNLTVYRMRWMFNDDLSELSGTSSVRFTNPSNKPLDVIYLRLFANYPNSGAAIDLHKIQVNDRPVTRQLEVEGTALRVPLARSLAPGQSIELQLDYTVLIPENNTAHYSDLTRQDWITTLPTVYPLIPALDAKGWHIELPPAFGDLVYAPSALYDVTISAPMAYQLIVSGTIVERKNEAGRMTWRVISAPTRDFYVVLTNALAKSSARVGDVTIHSWYLPAHRAAGENVLKWVEDAFRIFEKRFGSYPFKELEVVETPTTAGGIEYPGVITVSSGLYEDTAQRSFFEFAAVHETAHQWWYSTVGNDQVNAPWLDEALAQYATLVYLEEAYGKNTADEIRRAFLERLYEEAKAKYGDKPAGLPVNAYDEDGYGAFVYGKGPLFFQAVRDQIGDDLFFKALQTYYQQYKFRLAAPENLIEIFTQIGGQDITPLYQKWITGG